MFISFCFWGNLGTEEMQVAVQVSTGCSRRDTVPGWSRGQWLLPMSRRSVVSQHLSGNFCRSVTPVGLQGGRTPSLHHVPVPGGFWCPLSPLVTPPGSFSGPGRSDLGVLLRMLQVGHQNRVTAAAQRSSS